MSVSGKNFNPQNTQRITPDKIFAFLEPSQISSFAGGHDSYKNNNVDGLAKHQTQNTKHHPFRVKRSVPMTRTTVMIIMRVDKA